VHSDRSFHVDVLVWLCVLALVNGALHFLHSSEGLLAAALPLLFSVYLLTLNFLDLKAAIPVFERVQRERKKAKEEQQQQQQQVPTTASARNDTSAMADTGKR
jgi:hypothetical protein